MIQKSYEISETYRQVFLEYYKDLKEKCNKCPDIETKEELLKADEALSFLVFGV